MNFNNWNIGVEATLFIVVFFPIFLYFSYWLLISSIIGLYRMLESKKWKQTIGKIINAEIKYKDHNTDGETNFKPVIAKEYLYTVDGKEYKSNQTHASDSLFSKDFKPLNKSPEKHKEYSTSMNFINSDKEMKNLIGQPAKVYYDPQNPHKACLVPSVHNQIFLGIFMGLLFSCGITYIAYHILEPLFD